MFYIEMTCYLHVWKATHQGTLEEARSIAMKRFLSNKQYFQMTIVENDGWLRLCVDRT